MAHFDVRMQSERTTFPVKMYGGVPGRDGKSAYEVAKEEGFEGTKEEWLNSLKGDPGRTPQKGVDYMTPEDLAEIEENVLKSEPIEALQKAVADLQYVPIRLTGVYNNIGTVERGQEIKAIRISWALNKSPVRQTVAGLAVDAEAREYTLSLDEPLAWNANRSFEVTATDERELTAKASTGVTFLNGVYYGVLTDGEPIDSAAILGLTRSLQSGLGITFTATAGKGQRQAYACPSRYGPAAFIDAESKFPAGLSKAATVLFENASGYKENYDVYLAENAGLGKVTITVSKEV